MDFCLKDPKCSNHWWPWQLTAATRAMNIWEKIKAMEQWKKGPNGCFRIYRGWNPTQLCGDMFHGTIIIYKDPFFQQPGFNGKRFFLKVAPLLLFGSFTSNGTDCWKKSCFLRIKIDTVDISFNQNRKSTFQAFLKRRQLAQKRLLVERLPYHKTSLIQKKEVPYWKKDISTKISKVHFLYTMPTTCDMFHSRKFRMVALNQPLFFFCWSDAVSGLGDVEMFYSWGRPWLVCTDRSMYVWHYAAGEVKLLHYCDRNHDQKTPKGSVLVSGNPRLFQEKSRLVKYYNLARFVCTPLRINGWNLQITQFKEKIIWTTFPFWGSMFIFQGVFYSVGVFF